MQSGIEPACRMNELLVQASTGFAQDLYDFLPSVRIPEFLNYVPNAGFILPGMIFLVDSALML